MTLYKVQHGGVLPGGEQFSYHYMVNSTAGTLAAQNTLHSGAIARILATTVAGVSGVTTLAAVFPTVVEWTRTSVREWDPTTNKGVGASLSTGLTVFGTNVTLGMPTQVAHAITIRTAANGRRERNRFYHPPYGTNTTNVTGGRVHVNIIAAIAAAYAAENAHLQADATGTRIVVYSPADAVAKTATATYIGDVLDTIRRRRNKLVENRTTTAL